MQSTTILRLVLMAQLASFSCVRAGFEPWGANGDGAREGSVVDDVGGADVDAGDRDIGDRDVWDLNVGDQDAADAVSGKGAFVLYGDDARRLLSFDKGQTWTVDQQDSPATGSSDRALVGAAWGNGFAVLVGGAWGGSGGFALYSNDGSNWTESPIAGGQGPLGVAFGNGVFVSTNNVGQRYTSNGTAWTHHGTGGGLPSGRGICFGQGRFFTVDDTQISTSLDGLTWQTEDVGGTKLSAVACGTDRFIAVGDGRRLVTLDGLTVLHDESAAVTHKGLAFGDGVFVDRKCRTSTDGLSWTPDKGCDMRSITFGDGVFLAVEGGTDIMRSGDHGKSWQKLGVAPASPDASKVGFLRFP